MKISRMAAGGVLGALLVAGATGCPEPSAGERAGAAIDEAIEDARDKVGEVEDRREELADR